MCSNSNDNNTGDFLGNFQGNSIYRTVKKTEDKKLWRIRIAGSSVKKLWQIEVHV